MKIIGLTGGIGSGKSSILNLFKKKNISCFNTDIISKKLMDNELKEKIKTLFGTDIYKNEELNRKKISKIVFNDIEKLNKLNSIVHPAVRKNFTDFVKRNKNSRGFVIDGRDGVLPIEKTFAMNLKKQNKLTKFYHLHLRTEN